MRSALLGICFGLLRRPRCHPRISVKWAPKKEEVGEIDRLLSSHSFTIYNKYILLVPRRQEYLPALLRFDDGPIRPFRR